jgi:hypothetical protein
MVRAKRCTILFKRAKMAVMTFKGSEFCMKDLNFAPIAQKA